MADTAQNTAAAPARVRFDPASLGVVVVKIGTSLLSSEAGFNAGVMERLAQQIAALKAQHPLNIVLVSSGAVGVGMQVLGHHTRPADLRSKQAVAAVGQARLMHYYETLFMTLGGGLHTAQVLLSWADLAERRSYLNARNTLLRLFEFGNIVPIINENDSTGTEEFRFGENDTLAAKVAAKLGAGLFVLLTDVDGLYDRAPTANPDARLIEEVPEITGEIEAYAGGAGSRASTGGMQTKLAAARIATTAGVPVVIANGCQPDILPRLFAGTVPRTYFAPAREALSHRKRWVAFGQSVQGTLTLDAGAVRAVQGQGKSLLPAGITAVEGTFGIGACVRLADASGKDLARALVNFSSEDVRRIMGRRTSEIEAVLGHKDYDEVVHRDNLVLLS